MRHPRTLLGILCAAAIIPAPALAGSVTHTTYGDFKTGLSDGVAQAMGEFNYNGTDTGAGAIGEVPSPGASLVNDDFNYTAAAGAEAGGWLLLKPNESEITGASGFAKSEFLLSGDTSATGGAAPAAGSLRLRVGKPYDMYRTSNAGGRSPVLALWNQPITGDFIIETRLNIVGGRDADGRQAGLFVGLPDAIGAGGAATGVVMDDNARWIITAPENGNGTYQTQFRMYPISTVPFIPGGDIGPNGAGFGTGGTSKSAHWSLRIVKRGPYFYTYRRSGDDQPWALHTWIKNEDLANSPNGMVVGVFGKSNSGAVKPYKDIDFDYFRASRIGTDAGTFTNVMDAGGPVDWRGVSLDVPASDNALSLLSFPGTKYQVRAGNTLSGGTLTDAGDFTGPDGTAGTWFRDDVAAAISNAANRRYLEYKFHLDGSTANLPALVRQVQATFGPGGLASAQASFKDQFGADSATITNQPGDGDLSLARTQVYFDDFNTDESAGIGNNGPNGDYIGPAQNPNGWDFYSGRHEQYPDVVGAYSMTERPGFFRMKVGYVQNYWASDSGGLRLLRDLPAGTTDFEVETEVQLENQQNRPAGLIVWQDDANWFFIGAAKNHAESSPATGVQTEIILNNGSQGTVNTYYGSNDIQMRIAKVGTIITASVRDMSAPSPSWRVARVFDTAGRASGGQDFMPTRVGFLAKSNDRAARSTQNVDFAYLKISNLANSGQKDVPFTLPSGARVDSVFATGDAVGFTNHPAITPADRGIYAANAKAQISDGSGGFVGPDGTSATWFSADEPKIPDALAAQANPQVRLSLDAATSAGVPYLHTLGLQYAPAGAALAHDTNTADFNAGMVKTNISTATPGILGVAPALGTPNVTTFDTDPGAAWKFDNPSGRSNVSYTDNPGMATLNVGIPENLWSGTSPNDDAQYAFLHRAAAVTGDWQIEATVSFPIFREAQRQNGLAVFPAGGLVEGHKDFILFGPAYTDRFSLANFINDSNRVDANINAGPPDVFGLSDTTYTLRIRKEGYRFTMSYKDAGGSWVDLYKVNNQNLATAQGGVIVGVFGKSWGSPTDGRINPLPVTYDNFALTPITSATGTFESRVLDLGAAASNPTLSVTSDDPASVQIQVRAADTAAGLTSAAYTGPDGAATFYKGAANAAIAGAAGKRFVQYKAILTNGAGVNDVLVTSPTLPVPPTANALTALRIAAGLETATAGQMTALDVVKGDSAGKIDLADAVALLRAANGL